MSPIAPASPGPVLSRLSLFDLRQWSEQNALPAYRGRQLFDALNKQAIQDVEELTVFPLDLRRDLKNAFRVRTLSPSLHLRSKRDHSEKVLFLLEDGGTIESVLIRAAKSGGRTRNTICVSSQVGCPAACSFCATGLSGFSRNLSDSEIADQVFYFAHRLRRDGERVNSVVFMGMGEPFLNVRSVRGGIARLTDPEGLNLGERHITVSTVGIVPQIRKFAEWSGQLNLAVSLHAPNNQLRSTLVPYNQHFPISDVMDAVRFYIARTRRRVSFEYVLLRGVNDSVELAEELAALIHPLAGMAHVNVIPWNPFREGRFIRSEGPNAELFAAELQCHGVNVTVRYSKGLDISAACGQLREQAAAGSVP